MASADWILPGGNQRAGELNRRKQRKQRKTWPDFSASSATSCSRCFEVTDGISRLDPARREPASRGVEQEETEEAEENVARFSASSVTSCSNFVARSTSRIGSRQAQWRTDNPVRPPGGAPRMPTLARIHELTDQLGANSQLGPELRPIGLGPELLSSVPGEARRSDPASATVPS